MGTYQQSLPKICRTLTYSWEDFLAKIYQSRESEKDYQEAVADYFLKFCEYLKLKDQHIYSLKMSGTCLLSGKAKHSKQSCGKFQNWGMTANGLCFTARISENRSQDREFILKGLFGKAHDKLMMAKGKTKKHRYCLTSRRGLEIQTITGRKLAECPPELYEIMQGFQYPNWTEGLPKTTRKFLLGNAITPDIPKEIYKRLKSPKKD